MEPVVLDNGSLFTKKYTDSGSGHYVLTRPEISLHIDEYS